MNCCSDRWRAAALSPTFELKYPDRNTILKGNIPFAFREALKTLRKNKEKNGRK